MGLVVRPFEAHDEAGVRALLTKVFGDAGSFERFGTGNPLGEPLRIVALNGDTVVGCNIWNAWRVHSARPDAAALPPAYQSGGSAVDPDTRGQGIFAKLLKAGEEEATRRGIPYFIGFPNPASFKSFLRAGWDHVNSLELRVATVPALGVRRRPSLCTDAFARWRYDEVGASAATVTTRRGRFHAYFSRESKRGLPYLKLLDVLDDEGRRDLSALPSVLRRLPGPGPVLLRATAEALPEWQAVTVKREWKTPVIYKRLPAGDAEHDARVRTSPYLYGDIDAS